MASAGSNDADQRDTVTSRAHDREQRTSRSRSFDVPDDECIGIERGLVRTRARATAVRRGGAAPGLVRQVRDPESSSWAFGGTGRVRRPRHRVAPDHRQLRTCARTGGADDTPWLVPAPDGDREAGLVKEPRLLVGAIRRAERRPDRNDGGVPGDLATYLGADDESLVGYLDADRNLSEETVARLGRFAVAMSEGSMTPGLADADWPDFYPLVAAFVVVCGSDELRDLYDRSTVSSAMVRGDVPLTDVDRVFLVTLSDELEATGSAPGD